MEMAELLPNEDNGIQEMAVRKNDDGTSQMLLQKPKGTDKKLSHDRWQRCWVIFSAIYLSVPLSGCDLPMVDTIISGFKNGFHICFNGQDLSYIAKNSAMSFLYHDASDLKRKKGNIALFTICPILMITVL